MHIFVITKNNEPEQNFMAENYEKAKLYFQGYLLGDNEEYKYKLYKIGEIDKNLNVKTTKIYIAGGFETKNQYENDKELLEQLKLSYKPKFIDKKEPTTKIINELFDGREIK